MKPAEKGDFFVMSSQQERRCTITDIEALPEGERAELIDGRMYMMASPSLHHQNILAWLSAEIFNYIRKHGGKCRMIPAPFGVFIKKDDRNYLEPDISVICNRDLLDQRGCHGAPDWVIEIASPSSRRMDYLLKLPLYQETGVREYWIVDYDKRRVTVYCLQESASPVVYGFTDKVRAGIFADFEIDFSLLVAYLE